jgi:hypothetical protein
VWLAAAACAALAALAAGYAGSVREPASNGPGERAGSRGSRQAGDAPRGVVR